VPPFVKSNKNDAADAPAIWEATPPSPGMRQQLVRVRINGDLFGVDNEPP
jgi:hypothetical protein